ncbi:MAG: winged helix-turn-helix transcriptional regulator [Ectothiorhodospiraceae bacterium]|nr:winged helix-turn-helix transcriptional regulator [Ectothiorhodospiraceae bacterium]
MTAEMPLPDLTCVFDGDLLRALSEPTRVEILKILVAQGRQDVSAIAQRFPQDRSVISRHLRVMEEAGMLRSEREGRHTYYRLDAAGVLAKMEQMARDLRAHMEKCCPDELE